MTDDEKMLFDAQTDAQALMRDSANVAVLREAVEDWKREAARLKARVEELEQALTGLMDDLDQGAIPNDLTEFRRALPPQERP